MAAVHVKFFAIFREYVGLKEDWREIEPGLTVQDLWNHYTATAKNPRVANIRAAFSVNQRIARPETVLNGGEEVGFLPPVSGGAAKRASRAPKKSPAKKSASARLDRDFVVTAGTLSLDALVARVSHPGAGGITTFIGIVRDNADNKSVKYLEYEAYPELAERMLEQIGSETHERWHDVRLAIAHRTGRLEIGEASVIIAASAPHRADAFAACRYAIERLKVTLPVWKKEFASDTDYWVEGPTSGDVPPTHADTVVTTAAQAAASITSPTRIGTLGIDDVNLDEIRTDIESV